MQTFTAYGRIAAVAAPVFLSVPSVFAQQQDSIIIDSLTGVEVVDNANAKAQMSDVDGAYIWAGKKHELIDLKTINANLASNNVRQAFARVAGLTIWESDASGIQISVATRGLSPNRSWEFNTRQNGYDISADVFGYPEAYYNPPLEAVQSIQLVRGASSLQFGAQFGGLLNYQLVRPTTSKAFQYRTQNAVGSYDFLSSYNEVSGRIGKFSYLAYHHHRKGDTWRANSRYTVRNSHVFLQYEASEKARFSAEYTNSNYVSQQPGGLTDAQMAADPSQSLRARNWFALPWQLANLNADLQVAKQLFVNVKVFGLLGERNSIGFLARPNVLDTINSATLQYNNRQIDRDKYANLGAEVRGRYTFDFLGQKQDLAFGLRQYQATTSRSQRGRGDRGSDYNLDLQTADFPAQYEFVTQNTALFAEQLLNVTKQLSFTAGLRYENVSNSISGRRDIVNNAEVLVEDDSRRRSFLLAGLGAQFRIKTTNVYANFAQSYRPVLFSDLIPPTTTDVVDAELEDAKGFNIDLGYRGYLKDFLQFDVNAFYLAYNNRLGVLRRFINDDPTQGTYQYRTNVGNTRSQGVEAFVQFNPLKAFKVSDKAGSLDVFASLSFVDARYIDFEINSISGTAPSITIVKTNLKDNVVEYAPRYNHTFGLTYSIKDFSLTAQARFCSSVFADANNTVAASADGVNGEIAAYQVFDLSASYRIASKYKLSLSVNNLTDEVYATRRSGGYPGPGLLPAERRVITFGIGALF